MKTTFFTLVLMANVLAARSQGTTSTDGTIDFASQANPVEFLPSNGNAVSFAQLYWAPVVGGPYEPVSGVPVGFLSGAKAGFWDASSEPVVTTPGLAGGSQVLVVARVWGGTNVDNTGNGLWYGQSFPILVTTGNPGSPFTPPASISAMTSFEAVEAIPEPLTAALWLLGAVGLFMRRRR